MKVGVGHIGLSCRERKGKKRLEEGKILKSSLNHFPLALYVSSPMRSVAFYAPIIDWQDGFLVPIREEML